MFGVEDVIRKHPLAVIGLAAVAITAAKPPWRARGEGRARERAEGRGGVKAVVKLCLEASAAAETDIVCGLAEVAVDDVVCALSHAAPEARHEAARAAVHKFARRAHRRSARHARDESHRQHRYAQHVSALETRLLERHAAAPDAHKKTFEHALSALHDVRLSPPEPAAAEAQSTQSRRMRPAAAASSRAART